MVQAQLGQDNISDENREIISGMNSIEESFERIADKFDEIELLSEEHAPYGLMEKSRTISWLVEQIYVQNLKKNSQDLGLQKVEYPDDDLTVFDVEIDLPDDDRTYYANVKTGLVDASSNKNDLSKSRKLAKFIYERLDEEFTLLVINVKVDFIGDERKIDLKEDAISVDNVAWINEGDIYVNPSNKNLQVSLNKPPQIRDNKEFLYELLFADRGILDAIEERDAQIPVTEEKLGFDYEKFRNQNDF